MYNHQIFKAIGLMSGTSMDGIDAALIYTNGSDYIAEITAVHIPYTIEFQASLKAAEMAINHSNGNLVAARHMFDNDIASLDAVFTQSLQLHYAAVIKLLQQAAMDVTQIDVVGYHGQTFYHDPCNKITIQIGDAKQLSDALGVAVINNFRANDVAHGGQGAPFVPIYHQALALRDKLLPCVVVNCGGIANLSIISGPQVTQMTGYDAGPGNCLLDSFVKQRTNNMETCDLDGKYGLSGTINYAVLALLMANSCVKNGINYFDVPPPKSLDVRDFTLIPAMQQLSLQDGCATLAAFTAQGIVSGLSCNLQVDNWILVGGGWNNMAILQQLKNRVLSRFPAIKLSYAAEVGWDGQALEAQLMAFLAVRRLLELPVSFPRTTAVPYPLIGGDIYGSTCT